MISYGKKKLAIVCINRSSEYNKCILRMVVALRQLPSKGRQFPLPLLFSLLLPRISYDLLFLIRFFCIHYN